MATQLHPLIDRIRRDVGIERVLHAESQCRVGAVHRGFVGEPAGVEGRAATVDWAPHLRIRPCLSQGRPQRRRRLSE